MSQHSSKRATLSEVAALAGVSRSAVSRAFTEGASVSLKTRSKVERAAQELGYRPNVLARSLTTRKTGLVGLSPITSILRFFSKSLTCSLDSYKPLDYGH